jgi:hypothetical protein
MRLVFSEPGRPRRPIARGHPHRGSGDQQRGEREGGGCLVPHPDLTPDTAAPPCRQEADHGRQHPAAVVGDRHRRSCDAPDALSRLALQITLLDMALHDPDLGARLATSIRAQEDHLVARFTGLPHNGSVVTSHQARRLTTALRALFVGLSQGVPLGLAPDADEQYFADTARALASGMSLIDRDADTS